MTSRRSLLPMSVAYMLIVLAMIYYWQTRKFDGPSANSNPSPMLISWNSKEILNRDLPNVHEAKMAKMRNLQHIASPQLQVRNNYSRSTWIHDRNNIIVTLPSTENRRVHYKSTVQLQGLWNESYTGVLCFDSKTIHVSDNSKMFFEYMAHGAVLGWCIHDQSSHTSDIHEMMKSSAQKPAVLSPHVIHRKVDVNVRKIMENTASVSIEYPKCVPTSGKCVATFDELQIIVSRKSKDGDTISICEESTIEASSAINIRRNNITFCCESGPFQCLIVSTGSDTTIVVFGINFTIRGMIVTGGATRMYNGGNLAIEGDSIGSYVIDQCSFTSGSTLEGGGNIFVRSVNSVIISNSIFVNGYSEKSGGNVAVHNAHNVTVSNCLINAGISAMGGGITITYAENIWMYHNNITDNIATESSGGIDIVYPYGTVTLLKNNFINNHATRSGGGVTVTHDVTPPIPVSVTLNTGVKNDAQYCPDVAISNVEATALSCLSLPTSGKLPVSAPMRTPVATPKVKPILVPARKPIIPPKSMTAPVRTPLAISPIQKQLMTPHVPVRKPIQKPMRKPVRNPRRKPIAKPASKPNLN
jgi:ribosomal protein S17